MVATVIELTDELQRRIHELSVQTGRTESDILREAVATYVAAHQIPQPSSDGTIDDPHLAARDIDEWMDANWRPE
jgi:hypothetical protein